MKLFDENLLQNVQIMETLLKALGGNTPKIRYLQVDYKERGVDKNVSMTFIQNPDVDDKTMIGELLKTYANQGKKIGFVMEMDKNGQPVAPLYSTDQFLKECVDETLELLKKGNR